MSALTREEHLETALLEMRRAYGRLHDRLSDYVEGEEGAPTKKELADILSAECLVADHMANEALGEVPQPRPSYAVLYRLVTRLANLTPYAIGDDWDDAADTMPPDGEDAMLALNQFIRMARQAAEKNSIDPPCPTTPT